MEYDDIHIYIFIYNDIYIYIYINICIQYDTVYVYKYIYNDKIYSKGDPISSQFHQDIKTSRLVPSPSRHRGPDKARQGEHELDNWEEESEVHRALGAHHDTLDKKPDTKIEKT